MKQTNILIIVMLCFCFVFTGCSIVEKLQEERRADKSKGEMLESDARQFTFENIAYTILNETARREDISLWIGITSNLCFLNKEYEILKTSSILSYKDYLNEIKKGIPEETYYIVKLGNIFKLKDNRITIDVDGEFHVAKPSNSLSAEDKIIEIETYTSDGETET